MPDLAILHPFPTVPLVVGAVTALVLLLLLSAFFSAMETALLSLSKIRRRQLLEEKDPRARHVERLLDSPQRFLLGMRILDLLADVAAAVLATVLALTLWGGAYVAVALAGVAVLLLAFGEVVPKAYAAHRAEALALRWAPVLLTLRVVVAPAVWVFERLMSGTSRAFGRNPIETANQLRSEEELKALISLGTEEGLLEEEEEEMIHSVIEFAATTAKEVMIPRIDVVAVPGDATLNHVRAFVIDSGFSRIPVYQGSLDNITGILFVKDMLLRLLEGKGDLHVRDLAREPFLVPETKKLDDLLSEMRERRVHMAVVIDEFGGTAGILTLEDVLEEIVGEIFDEYDLRTEHVRKLDERTAVVDARTHVEDVNEALGLRLPEDEPYDTVGGFVFHALGRLGREGEVLHEDGFDLVVEKATNRRILRVRIVKHEPRPPGREPEVERVAEPEP